MESSHDRWRLLGFKERNATHKVFSWYFPRVHFTILCYSDLCCYSAVCRLVLLNKRKRVTLLVMVRYGDSRRSLLFNTRNIQYLIHSPIENLFSIYPIHFSSLIHLLIIKLCFLETDLGPKKDRFFRPTWYSKISSLQLWSSGKGTVTYIFVVTSTTLSSLREFLI